MLPLTINRLASGGVITTYQCVSKCGHCLYNHGPHRPQDYLDESQAGIIFRRIAAPGCRSVHIGGGEPLLQPEKLAASHQTHYGKHQRRMPAWTKSSRWAGCSNG